MIHLNLSNGAGGTVYLDVQAVDARLRWDETVFILSGTLGDGLSEGKVLVEIGDGVEITFLDGCLEGGDLRPLFSRIGREAVIDALARGTAGLLFCFGLQHPDTETPQVTGYGRDGRWFPLRPRFYCEQLELPLLVAEEKTGWERQAA